MTNYDELLKLSEWVFEQPTRAERRNGEWQERAADAESRRILRRRRDFELMLGEYPEDLSNHQRARAWELADAQPLPDRLTRDDIEERMGSARYP